MVPGRKTRVITYGPGGYFDVQQQRRISQDEFCDMVVAGVDFAVSTRDIGEDITLECLFKEMHRAASLGKCGASETEVRRFFQKAFSVKV